MMAAQLFRAACRAEPEIVPCLEVGDFGPLRSWLRTHVHAKGSLLTTEELLVAVTGRPLEAGMFRAHLQERYIERKSA
jgi:carboxypeptidase Taq